MMYVRGDGGTVDVLQRPNLQLGVIIARNVGRAIACNESPKFRCLIETIMTVSFSTQPIE